MSRNKFYREGRFYKDIKLIIFCRKCGVQFRPRRFSARAQQKMCFHCYKKFVAFPSNARKIAAYHALTPEQKKEYYKKSYQRYLKWCSTHKELKKKRALASYHQNKHKHKTRKHRATRNQAVS